MSKVPDYAVVSTSVEITKIFFPKYSNLTNALLRKISNEKLKFHCPDEEKVCKANDISGYPTIKCISKNKSQEYSGERTLDDLASFVNEFASSL